MSKAIASLPIGARVMDPDTTHFGAPIVWLVADIGYVGELHPYPDNNNSVTLISEKNLRIMSYDAPENNYPDGNSLYKDSNIRQWLNSDKNDWFVAQTPGDKPPSSQNAPKCPYDKVAGFLSGFSTNMKEAILTTTVDSINPNLAEYYTDDKVYLMSTYEIDGGKIYEKGNKLKAYKIFKDYKVRDFMPTEEVISNFPDLGLDVNKYTMWWTRSPHFNPNVQTVCTISQNYTTTMRPNLTYSMVIGPRPAFNVARGFLVSNEPDENGIYTVVWDAPYLPFTLRPV